MLLFFASQLIHNSRKRQKDIDYNFWLQIAYHAIIFLGSFIITIGYAVGERPEGYGWGIILIAVQICNLMVLLVRHTKARFYLCFPLAKASTYVIFRSP